MTPEIMALAADFPMAAPPPGVTANLDNPMSDAWQIFVLDGFCTALMLAFTAARIFSTTWLGQRANRIHELVFYTGLVTSLAAVTITICGTSCASPSQNDRADDFFVYSNDRQESLRDTDLECPTGRLQKDPPRVCPFVPSNHTHGAVLR